MAEREEENRRKREQLAIRAEDLQKELSLRYYTDKTGSTVLHRLASLAHPLPHVYTQSDCVPSGSLLWTTSSLRRWLGRSKVEPFWTRPQMSGVCGHQTLGMIRLLTSLSQWCVRYSTLLWVHRSGTRVPRPVSRAGSLRPTSGCARIVAASGNPRYLVCGPVPAVTLTHTRHTLSPSLSLSLSKADNILRVELDMPNRTTRDYECPSVAPSLRAALSRAMAEEEEMTVDAG